ncbi:hypothetical protein BDP81DRAFT_117351 [Colletotrichum phormii]|uniref:Secreted protein n=1 Tax=Colletotrichum phormii TaxID=359342 RepID=A0AAJ0EAC6_9PEZI|nr:uncharacterized protein BDP81DRAFT_117351 [Colletotrichum phormii]KAK1623775.1 hypothetical protein BDP81DRAFT_117351 [Colletotrichum phormii]
MRRHLQPPWATSSPSALLLHMQMSLLVQATLDGGKIISASPICQPCRISHLIRQITPANSPSSRSPRPAYPRTQGHQ